MNHARQEFTTNPPKNLWEFELNESFIDYINNNLLELPSGMTITKNFNSNAVDSAWGTLSFLSSTD